MPKFLTWNQDVVQNYVVHFALSVFEKAERKGSLEKVKDIFCPLPSRVIRVEAPPAIRGEAGGYIIHLKLKVSIPHSGLRTLLFISCIMIM